MVIRDAAIVRLILFTGLRVGEVVQLRLSDVTLDERRGNIVVREGKGTKNPSFKSFHNHAGFAPVFV
jgi:integrase